MNESTLSNVLIHQKDHIRGLVLEEKYEEASLLLEFVKEFWESSEYGYKYQEIRNIISNTIRSNMILADHWKQKEKWENLLHKLGV